MRFRGWKAGSGWRSRLGGLPRRLVETRAPPGLPIAPPLAIGLGLRLGAVERIHPPQPRLHDPVVYCVVTEPLRASLMWGTGQEHQRRGMLPLYAARIEDLGPGDFVKIDCAACHHVALLTPGALLRVGLSPGAKVLDLKGRFRCRGCGRKGRAVVSIKWAHSKT